MKYSPISVSCLPVLALAGKARAGQLDSGLFKPIIDEKKGETLFAFDNISIPFTRSLERENTSASKQALISNILGAAFDPRVLLFVEKYFCRLVVSNGLGFFAKRAVGWSSDRRGHTVALLGLAAMELLGGALSHGTLLVAIDFLCLVVIGLTGYTPSLWAYAISILRGTAGGAAIGLINSIGNLGSFAGSYLMGNMRESSDGFSAGSELAGNGRGDHRGTCTVGKPQTCDSTLNPSP